MKLPRILVLVQLVEIRIYNKMSSKFETVDSESQRVSLIKYEGPVDITQKLEAYEKAKMMERANQSRPSSEDILNTVLPPREWKNSRNQYFMQYVSHERPEREDVEQVQRALEQALTRMQARTDAVCPIRQHLFSQAFDEIIRQVTLNCPERGLMLLRVRDERKMTIAAHQTLYQEAKAYGMRKQYESEDGMGDVQARLSAAELKKEELERKMVELLSKKASMEHKYRERKVVQAEKREYEVSALAKQNSFLERFILSRKAAQVEQPSDEKDEEEIID